MQWIIKKTIIINDLVAHSFPMWADTKVTSRSAQPPTLLPPTIFNLAGKSRRIKETLDSDSV